MNYLLMYLKENMCPQGVIQSVGTTSHEAEIISSNFSSIFCDM
jgi:hypothetical protein